MSIVLSYPRGSFGNTLADTTLSFRHSPPLPQNSPNHCVSDFFGAFVRVFFGGVGRGYFFRRQTMNTQTQPTQVTRELVPEDQRMVHWSAIISGCISRSPFFQSINNTFLPLTGNQASDCDSARLSTFRKELFLLFVLCAIASNFNALPCQGSIERQYSYAPHFHRFTLIL